MVKLGIRLLAVLVVLALAYWAWTIFFPSPSKIVRQRLEQITRFATFSESENGLAKAVNSQKLAALFAPHLEIRIDAPGIENREFTSREDLYEVLLAARATARSVHTKLYHVSVEMAASQREAIANAALRVDVGDQKDALVEQLKFIFKNIDGEWLVTSVVSEK